MKYLFDTMIMLGGAICAYLAPTIPYLLVCTFAIFVDCFTAFLCAKRVKDKYPEKVGKNGGKFSSSKFAKVFTTLLMLYSIIVMVYIVQQVVFEGLSVYLPNIVSGAFCFYTLTSILENVSTARDARWAKFLQKFFTDKAERHFGVDLDGDGKIGKSKRKRVDNE